jgi:DnaJ-class molecular chaperone
MDDRGGKDRDLYEALGVSRDDDAQAIRKAYRKLARQYHPDVNPGDAAAEERFKEISRAYAVLSDPDKRRNYDEFGQVSLDSGFDAEAARRAKASFGARFGGARGGGFEGGFAEDFSFGDLDDMFGRIFTQRGGGPSRAPRPRRGPDLQTEIELDFLEAARGGEHRISLERAAADGSGRQERLAIRIPPGVADGGRIRLAGKGGEGRSGGPPGDLHLKVRVRPHPVLRREGRDLHVEVPIGVSEAVLGVTIEVPTLEGRASVTVPEGTDSGRKLRLRGKGIPDPKGGPPGDLFVTVQIRVPRDLDAEARAKFEELAELGPTDLRKGMDP